VIDFTAVPASWQEPLASKTTASSTNKLDMIHRSVHYETICTSISGDRIVIVGVDINLAAINVSGSEPLVSKTTLSSTWFLDMVRRYNIIWMNRYNIIWMTRYNIGWMTRWKIGWSWSFCWVSFPFPIPLVITRWLTDMAREIRWKTGWMCIWYTWWLFRWCLSKCLSKWNKRQRIN